MAEKKKHSNKGIPQNRETHEKRVKKLVEAGVLKTRYVTFEGLSMYLSTPVGTIRNAYAELPKQWTMENLKAALAKGFVCPPAMTNGKTVIFDLFLVDEFMKLCSTMGQLPREDEAS